MCLVHNMDGTHKNLREGSKLLRHRGIRLSIMAICGFFSFLREVFSGLDMREGWRWMCLLGAFDEATERKRGGCGS